MEILTIYSVIALLFLTLLLSPFSNAERTKYCFNSNEKVFQLLKNIFKRENILNKAGIISSIISSFLMFLVCLFVIIFIYMYITDPSVKPLSLKKDIEFLIASTIFSTGILIWLGIQTNSDFYIFTVIDKIIKNNHVTYSKELINFLPFIKQKIYYELEMRRENLIKSLVRFFMLLLLPVLADLIFKGDFVGNYLSGSLIISVPFDKIPSFVYVSIIIMVMSLISYFIFSWVYSMNQIKNMCMDEIYNIEKTIRFKTFKMVGGKSKTRRRRVRC